MAVVAVLGVVLIVLSVLSRLYSLSLYRRISASLTRAVEPSSIPGTPWFMVQSDRQALKVIVWTTYGAALAGMVLVLAGVFA